MTQLKKIIVILTFLVCNTTIAYATSDVAYLNFIKKENPYISEYTAKDILHAVKYYSPRYFKNKKGGIDAGIRWTLIFMAKESNFRNINGDEGLSIGYMQIQVSTCDLSRKYNGIKKKLNLISRWGNIHCGMSELNRLYEKLDGDWDLIAKAYNGGIASVLYPHKYAPANRMTTIYRNGIFRKKQILLKIIQQSENVKNRT